MRFTKIIELEFELREGRKTKIHEYRKLYVKSSGDWCQIGEMCYHIPTGIWDAWLTPSGPNNETGIRGKDPIKLAKMLANPSITWR